mgnify:CR=1 FL=1
MLAAFLGGMLGIASALILELSQRRIRSAEDLSITIDLPVLAELKSFARYAGKATTIHVSSCPTRRY